jgi:hypothetical protein
MAITGKIIINNPQKRLVGILRPAADMPAALLRRTR